MYFVFILYYLIEWLFFDPVWSRLGRVGRDLIINGRDLNLALLKVPVADSLRGLIGVSACWEPRNTVKIDFCGVLGA